MALPKALNEAWLIFQVLMVRIHFPPAASHTNPSIAAGSLDSEGVCAGAGIDRVQRR